MTGGVEKLAEVLHARIAADPDVEGVVNKLADAIGAATPAHVRRALDFAVRDLGAAPFFELAADRQAVGWHEAGHAVISEVLGQSVASVDIVGSISLNRLGAMHPAARDRSLPADTEARLAATIIDAIVTLAGPEGEQLGAAYVPPERHERHAAEVYRTLSDGLATADPLKAGSPRCGRRIR